MLWHSSLSRSRVGQKQPNQDQEVDLIYLHVNPSAGQLQREHDLTPIQQNRR